jgi:hypothetical protein
MGTSVEMAGGSLAEDGGSQELAALVEHRRILPTLNEHDDSPPLNAERVATPCHARLVRSSVKRDEITYRTKEELGRVNRFREAFTLITLAVSVRHALLLECPDFRLAGSASAHEHQQQQQKSHHTGHDD